METPGPESLSFRSWVRSRSPHQMSLICALIYGILSQILKMATLYLGTFPHWVGLLMSYCRIGNTIHYCWSYNLCWGGKAPPSPRHGETKRKVIWWPADLTSFSSLLSFGQKTYQFPCQHGLTCSISTEGRKVRVGSKWMRTWKALLTNVPAHYRRSRNLKIALRWQKYKSQGCGSVGQNKTLRIWWWTKAEILIWTQHCGMVTKLGARRVGL